MSALDHPRDAFICHQEDLQRQAEGDVVDTSADQKVRVELQHLSDDASSAMIFFSHEDHTLGNPLRHVLMQNPSVATAGYTIPHPLEPKMLLHVQANDYAVDVVAAGLERLAQLCDETRTNFDAAMREAGLSAAPAAATTE